MNTSFTGRRRRLEVALQPEQGQVSEQRREGARPPIMERLIHMEGEILRKACSETSPAPAGYVIQPPSDDISDGSAREFLAARLPQRGMEFSG